MRTDKTKVCTKCGKDKSVGEFAWMDKRRQRKSRCRACTNQPFPSIGEPSPITITYEEALSLMQGALKDEAALAKAWSQDSDHRYFGDPVGAIDALTKPRRIPNWNSIAGLPASVTIGRLKSYMMEYQGDPDTLPYIMQTYRERQDAEATAKRERRLARKVRRFEGKGGRLCEHCGSEIPNTADARRKYCSNACKVGAHRERKLG